MEKVSWRNLHRDLQGFPKLLEIKLGKKHEKGYFATQEGFHKVASDLGQKDKSELKTNESIYMS